MTSMHTMTRFRQALGRARHLPAYFAGRGGRPLALGALLLATSTVGTLATTNTPPEQHNVRLSSSSILQGETVTLTGAIQDPDVDDAHTVIIYWDNGSSEVRQKI